MRVATLLTLAVLLAVCLPASAAESTALHPDGSPGAAPAGGAGLRAEPKAERIATGLDAVVNLAFGPDAALYYGQWKTGDVYRLRDGASEKVLDVGEPAWGNERGFVGLAVDAQGSFYTFTTYEGTDGWFNRLSRWDDGKEVPLLDNLPAGDWHNSGRIQVDPRDGTLWVAYGDVNGKMVAQDPQDLRGKILHMTRDGKPVPGNLADGSLAFSLGHRQPFGFAVDSASGRVMVAENMDKKNDEVSLVEAGRNYGWPVCEGPCASPDERYTDPILYYPVTIGPTSGAFLGGEFYFGDFNRGQLHRVYQADGAWLDQIVYTHAAPPLLDLKPGPEGNTLYFSTWSDIWKLTFEDVTPTNGTGPVGGDPPAVVPPLGTSPIPLPLWLALAPVAIGALRRARR